MPPSCCALGGEDPDTPARDTQFIEALENVPPASDTVQSKLRGELVDIPGGFFEMGARQSRYPPDLDHPRRKVFVSPFRMSPVTVTNDAFARFIDDAGYRTVAEVLGWSFVFHLALFDPASHPESPPGLRWWRRVDGACWSSPEGPGSCIADRRDHPVVHVAWYDAQAYCKWSGLSLPSEAQWEIAARGGLRNKKFPWGNQMLRGGQHAMNTFQGIFPDKDTGDDGFVGTAPGSAFKPNGYGLYNMTGNVWEWTADRFGPLPGGGTRPPRDPEGAPRGYPRVQRGGSFLCHESYCDRYHVHSRTKNDPDTSTANIGFRVSAGISS